ncbi:MAG: hypothetical protein NVS1B12_11310 [Acidimicrobiales bacterium]
MSRPIVAVSAAVAVLVAGGLAFMRPGASRRAAAVGPPVVAPTSTASSPSTTTTTTSTTSTLVAPTTTTTVDVGTLPQTRDKPSGSDPALAARMQLVVQAVASGDPSGALPAFFPLTAYEQVKTVANPGTDWKYRLVSLFDQDIGALHRSIGASAPTMTFTGVDVPDSTAQWVNPGAEYNRIGYWRVYNTKVRYSAGSTTGSFIVISMISWRGQWYVVHFRTPPR